MRAGFDPAGRTRFIADRFGEPRAAHAIHRPAMRKHRGGPVGKVAGKCSIRVWHGHRLGRGQANIRQGRADVAVRVFVAERNPVDADCFLHASILPVFMSRWTLSTIVAALNPSRELADRRL